MRFGIFSNGQRHMTDVARSWDEDLHEIVVADQVGLSEAWVSEHTGSTFLPDALPCPELMIAKAAGMTRTIVLGSAVRRIALYPPVQVAMDAAVCDNLTDGRYIFGYGAGGPASGFEQRGIDLAQGREMMDEAIALILRCWDEAEPFSHHGRFYHGDNINVFPKPRAGGRVPTAVATTRDSALATAAAEGFRVLTSQFTRPGSIRDIGDRFSAFAAKVGNSAPRAAMSAARAIFIADSDEAAFAQVESGWREHLEYNKRYFGPALREYAGPGIDIADITFEHLLDQRMVFVGSPSTVAELIRDFHAEAGGFGTLLAVTGKNWGSREQRERSLELFSGTVAPMLADLVADAPVPSMKIRATG